MLQKFLRNAPASLPNPKNDTVILNEVKDLINQKTNWLRISPLMMKWRIS